MKRMTFAFVAAITVAVLPFPGICSPQEVGRDRQQELVPLPLGSYDCERAAKRLKSLLGEDITVAWDKETNTVFIRASEDKVREAKEILKRLDIALPRYNYAVTLKNADAAETVKVLQAIVMVFRFLGDERDVHIIPTWAGKTVVFRASDEKAAQLKAILQRLDVKATAP